MTDMRQTIIPKSDQLNADDLIGRDLTIKITGVAIRGGQEQPVAISFEGDNGKPYKACKSMCRVMVSAWGADSSKYVGRSMTLYRDPTVKWGGMDVGGIRISHMSNIEKSMTMALTMTRANKKPFTVKPLASGAKPATAPVSTAANSPPPSQDGVGQSDQESVADYITPDQVTALDARCGENGIPVDGLKRAAKVERLAMILAADFDRANDWITASINKRKETAAHA